MHVVTSANNYTKRLMDWRLSWIDTARPKQLPPEGDWQFWALICGRGFGKTRIGAEETGYSAVANELWRLGVVGRTFEDARSVCFEGESGLLNVIPPFFVKKFNRQLLELELINGSLIVGKSAERPDALRGPQWHGGWGDEVAAWGAVRGKRQAGKDEDLRLRDTFNNWMFGMRLGKAPRVLLTTTPRPLKFLREIVANPRARVTTGSTFENKANLAASSVEMFNEVYAGTRLGRQELYGDILDTNQNALWKPGVIEGARVSEAPSRDLWDAVAVSIDPAVTTEDQSDETGIIVAVRVGRNIYVMEDHSGHYEPHQWARIALSLAGRYDSDIVVETNQGGDLCVANLTANLPEFTTMPYVKKVHAKRGKYLRAEPIAALYEQGRVHHVGVFPELENQMCNFTGSSASGSPDRLDALVYAVGELGLHNHARDFW